MIGPQLPPGIRLGHPANENGDASGQLRLAEIVQVTSLKPLGGARVNVGGGISNTGNTCFLAAVLQCLAYAPPLNQALRNGVLHGFHGACPLAAKGQVCIACMVEKQLLAILACKRGSAIRPSTLVPNLHLLSKAFRNGRQEDAHELLVTLLDGVERASKRALGMLGFKAQHTLIEELFSGQLISQVRCEECGVTSNNFQTLSSLSLDLGRSSNLEGCMAAYSASEILDGANKYQCEKCKRLVRARKSMAIYDEPNILVVHFKRFDALSYSGKNTRHLKFPPNLRLQPAAGMHKPAAADGRVPVIGELYVLSSVVVHSGSGVHSGHYISYIRDSAGKWALANDSSVYDVSQEQVHNAQAYLCLYTRTKLKLPAVPPSAVDASKPGAVAAADRAPSLPAAKVASFFVYGPQRPPTQNGTASVSVPHSAVNSSLPASAAISHVRPTTVTKLGMQANGKLRTPVSFTLVPKHLLKTQLHSQPQSQPQNQVSAMLAPVLGPVVLQLKKRPREDASVKEPGTCDSGQGLPQHMPLPALPRADQPPAQDPSSSLDPAVRQQVTLCLYSAGGGIRDTLHSALLLQQGIGGNAATALGLDLDGTFEARAMFTSHAAGALAEAERILRKAVGTMDLPGAPAPKQLKRLVVPKELI